MLDVWILELLNVCFRMGSEISQLCLEALSPLTEQCAKNQEKDSPLFIATRHFLKVCPHPKPHMQWSLMGKPPGFWSVNVVFHILPSAGVWHAGPAEAQHRDDRGRRRSSLHTRVPASGQHVSNHMLQLCSQSLPFFFVDVQLRKHRLAPSSGRSLKTTKKKDFSELMCRNFPELAFGGLLII